MFVPTRTLRAAGMAVLAAAGGWWLSQLLLLLLLPPPPAGESRPAWAALEPGPGLRYMDGSDEDPPGLSLKAAAAILIEAHTGTVLFARNEHERRPMASTTKIMTALVALENAVLDERATVSSRAVRVPGSEAGLRPGQSLTMLELLHGLLLPSGNDAANVIAEHVAGSEEAFVELMNARARELGAVRTRFANAHGLDAPDHYSTAYDLAVMARTAMLYPTFSRIVATPEFQPESISRTWRNTNRMLWAFEGIEGVKTGTTSGAGYCLVAAASRSGMRLIAVVLGSPDRYGDTVRLLEYGFDRFHLLTLASHGRVLARVQVPGGLTPLEAVVDGDFRLVVRDADINGLQVRVVLDDLRPPLAAGQVVGRLEVEGTGGRRLQLVPILAREGVARWTPLGALWRWLRAHLL